LGYSEEETIKENEKNIKLKIVFQCRVKPTVTKHTPKIFTVADHKEIRPYRVCFLMK